jgi:large subunit ribosomal protein L6
MTDLKNFNTFVDMPEGVSARLEDDFLIVAGPKGETKKLLKHPRVNIEVKSNQILIETTVKKPSASDKMFINTFRSHVRNLVVGVQKGFVAKVRILSHHFPLQIEVKGSQIIAKNFLGEKVPRKVNVLEGAKVKVQGDLITIEGLNKEIVGQISGTIERLTRVTNKDRRKFQDGCFIIQKAIAKDE